MSNEKLQALSEKLKSQDWNKAISEGKVTYQNMSTSEDKPKKPKGNKKISESATWFND